MCVWRPKGHCRQAVADFFRRKQALPRVVTTEDPPLLVASWPSAWELPVQLDKNARKESKLSLSAFLRSVPRNLHLSAQWSMPTLLCPQ